MEKADANMPEVPETGEDRSVGGTASENAPEVPENGSDRSVGGSASVGDDGVIDPGSEKSSIQKGDGTGVTEQADDKIRAHQELFGPGGATGGAGCSGESPSPCSRW